MMLKTKALGTTVKSALTLAAMALLPFSGACSLGGEGNDGELDEAEAGGPGGGGGGGGSTPAVLLSGLSGAQGSTVGPDGRLYVTEGIAGTIRRVDPNTGSSTVFASGLPQQIASVGLGGPVDVAFVGPTAYALVTLVGSDVGGSSAVGIYRINSSTSSTLIADVGAFSIANPPATDFFIPSGVQFALEVKDGALLVSDGHHNRILRVTTSGSISILRSFGNIVPTGMEVSGDRVFSAQAGPVPHLAADGKIISFRNTGPETLEASGGRLLVDVEIGAGETWGLSQGFFDPASPEGSPAQPNTGALLAKGSNRTFRTITSNLDRPTSVEIIGRHAYVVTIPGQILKIRVD